jgi:hypothetical protein
MIKEDSEHVDLFDLVQDEKMMDRLRHDWANELIQYSVER